MLAEFNAAIVTESISAPDAMSLARRLQSQSKGHEAHQMLAAVYGKVTEGYDTANLKEARALLAITQQ